MYFYLAMCRIPDFVGLNDIYNELRTMPDLAPQLQIIVLSSAPILGKWYASFWTLGVFSRDGEGQEFPRDLLV